MIRIEASTIASMFPLRWVRTALTCLCLYILTACTNEENSTELVKLNDLGVAQMGQFQYASAYDTFRTVLDRNPDLIEVRVNLAIATLNRQDPGGEQQTLDILQDVLREEPEHQRALYTSGIVHLYLGNPVETINFLSKVWNLDPTDAYNAYFLGQAHLQIEEYEEAKDWFLQTIDLDEYLRSAYWAASTAARRLDDISLANELVQTYSRYDANPLSKTAGISYKEMGPKAETIVLSTTTRAEPHVVPTGDVVDSSIVLIEDASNTHSFTISDFDQDADWDIHYVNEGCIYTLENVEEKWQQNDSEASWRCMDTLTDGDGAKPSLYWGDLDNDLSIDLVICSASGVRVVKLNDNFDATNSSIFSEACNDGVLYDADHDGDLDFLAVSRGRLHLLNNNLDGTFSDISATSNLDQITQITSVNVGDFDADRDLDIAVLDVRGRLHLLKNNRTWSYEQTSITSTTYTSGKLAVADLNSDGAPNLLISERNEVNSWQFNKVSQTFELSESINLSVPEIIGLSTVDFDGDGALDILARSEHGVVIHSPKRDEQLTSIERRDLEVALPLYQPGNHGPALLTASSSGIELHPPGPGRSNFVSLQLTGKIDSDQMRSNASAIGSRVKVRSGDSWSVLNTIGGSSERGQSLQPLSVGLAGNDHANFVEILWTDGVTQSEIELASGELHKISEMQRQLASCPVVFVWNGQKYEFVSDVLGVAALGYFYKVGENAPFRDFERILLGAKAIQPKDGYFEVKIGEPMEEVLYLDSAFIDTYDVPSTHGLVIDERLHVNSAPPTGRPIVYKEEHSPSRAILNNSINVTTEVNQQDFVAPPLDNKDPNYIGLLEEKIELRLEFDEPLKSEHAVLVVYGWVEFPYSQTVFAASQSGRTYDPPTLDIKLPDGTWQTLSSQFGYPAGMPKQMTLPLPNLPENVREIRLTTNMEIYWDRIRIVYEDPNIKPKHHRTEPSTGHVLRNGFAKRSTGSHRVPYYDYNERSPYWDAKHATGMYSQTGEVTELITQSDNSLAIVGSGEEIHLKFPDYLPQSSPDHTRYYVLEFRGWAKDLDMYTEYGDTVEPIPSTGLLSREDRSKRARLHREYNTRFRSGFVTH